MCARSMIAFVSVTTLLLLSACSKPEPPKETEGEPGEVENLVFDTGAKWQSKPEFDALYAVGATLSDKDRQQFKGLFVLPIANTVKIDGDAATIKVTTAKDVGGESVESTVTWEAVKAGGTWKLDKTPLE